MRAKSLFSQKQKKCKYLDSFATFSRVAVRESCTIGGEWWGKHKGWYLITLELTVISETSVDRSFEGLPCRLPVERLFFAFLQTSYPCERCCVTIEQANNSKCYPSLHLRKGNIRTMRPHGGRLADQEDRATYPEDGYQKQTGPCLQLAE